jgi:hypothetical protein
MCQLGYDWQYAAERPTLTTQGFEEKLLVTKTESDLATSRPLLIVVSRPCARTCEASESALLNVLLYIDDSL